MIIVINVWNFYVKSAGIYADSIIAQDVLKVLQLPDHIHCINNLRCCTNTNSRIPHIMFKGNKKYL